MPRRAPRLAAATAIAAASTCVAQPVATWQDPIDGSWSDAGRWSTGEVPGQAGTRNVRAAITVGSGYEVKLDVDADLAGFTLTAPGAVFSLTGTGRSLRTTGLNTFESAVITGGPSSTIEAVGNTTFRRGAFIAGVSMFRLRGTAEFQEDNDFELCDTCIAISADTGWTGGGSFVLDGAMGEIIVEQSGSLTVSGSGSRSVTAIGQDKALINRGRLTLDLAGGTLDIDGAAFANESGGRVRVDSGTLAANAFDSAPGGTLTGGSWDVRGSGAVDLQGVSISALDASVRLQGAGSGFEALDTLSTIGGGGSLTIAGGRDFDAAGAFTVAGALEVGSGSRFDAAGGLTNLTGGTLSGGSFVIEGELALAGGGIATLAADLTLADGGSIVASAGGSDLLAGLQRIDGAGSLALEDGAAFSTAGGLTLEGRLRIGEGSAADVAGDLSAFQNGLFTGAALSLAGSLTADNARVERVAGTLTIGRDGTLLDREGGGTVDGLAFLRRVEATGTLALVGGRVQDVSVNNVAFEVAGTLELAASGLAGAAGVNTGSALVASSYAHEATGVLRVGIGGADDFGRVVAPTAIFGSGLAGETAGTLVLVLAEGLTVSMGDEFVLIEAAAVLGEGFATLLVEGDLADGLGFEQFTDARGLGVRVVPAPGGLVALGLFAARRRRRA